MLRMVKPWVIISWIHFTCNLPSLMKTALIIATEGLDVLRAAHSFNSEVVFQGVCQELGNQLCLVWAKLVKTGENHAPSTGHVWVSTQRSFEHGEPCSLLNLSRTIAVPFFNPLPHAPPVPRPLLGPSCFFILYPIKAPRPVPLGRWIWGLFSPLFAECFAQTFSLAQTSVSQGFGLLHTRPQVILVQ